MDCYIKGKNEEELLHKDKLPISNLPEKFGWLEVTGSSNVKKCADKLWSMTGGDEVVVVSGSGPNTTKIVTLVEIIKRKYKVNVLNIEVGERIVKEYWDPKPEYEELESLVVTRRIPTIHVVINRKNNSSKHAQKNS